MTLHKPATGRSVHIRSLGAAAAAGVLVLTGCSGGAAPASAPTAVDSTTPITLKLSTFGDSAAVKKIAEKYRDVHPNITVEVNTVANAEDARTNLLTKLAAGTGLADVEQLEVAWTGQLAQYSNQFVPLAADQNGAFVSIQADPVALPDGKSWAYGMGTGPEAICYRANMLADAGLPADADGVAKLVGGTWEEYFAAGADYAAKGGKGKWYDSSYMIYLAQVEQLQYPYEDADNKVVVDNPELEAVFKDTLAQADKLSAKLSAFSDDWNNGMGTGKYATMTCPSWLLSTIEGNSKNVTDWRIANAFPGGGGNIGGSFLAVPNQSKHPAEAAELASWLTAPDQQIAAFKAGSAFPGRTQALDSPALQDVTNKFFDNARVGTIFADRSKAIKTVIHKGPAYIAIDTAAFNAMTRVEAGQQSIDDAWTQFVTEAKAAQK